MMQKMRWLLLAIAFLVLIAFNAKLQVQRSGLVRERDRLETFHTEQIQTINEAKSQKTKAWRLAAIEKQQLDRLYAMLKWAKTPADFLVRSGDQIVSQIHCDNPSHIRMLVYLPDYASPETSHQLKFSGFRDLWNESHSALNRELEASSEKAEPMDLKLPADSSGVHEIEFKLAKSSALEVIVDGSLQHSFPIKPFKRPGSSFGPYFTKAFPNQAYGWTKNSGEQSMVPRHMLIDHTFDLTTSVGKKRMYRGIPIQCWVESNEPVSASAAHVAAYLPSVVEDFLTNKQIQLEDVPDLFETYQGGGRLFFDPRHRFSLK